MVIREATQADIPLIHQLAHDIWPTAYADILSGQQLTYMLELIYSYTALKHQMIDQQQFLLVEDDDTVVGFAAYSPYDDNNGFKLHKLYVLPSQQGKGLGKYLLENVIARIRSSGGKSVILNVNRKNRAKHFYEKLGFQIISEENISIGDGYFMNDYIMRLPLM